LLHHQTHDLSLDDLCLSIGWSGRRVNPHPQRTSSRLQVVAPYIKEGVVLFLRSLSRNCPAQTFDLGVESRDDLNDTLVCVLEGLANRAWNCGRSVELLISRGKKDKELHPFAPTGFSVAPK
jgi:hypothetical protein